MIKFPFLTYIFSYFLFSDAAGPSIVIIIFSKNLPPNLFSSFLKEENLY